MESEPVPLMASSAVLMLVGAGRFLQRRVDAELAALGLTLRHLGALGHLAHRPDLSYSDLARRSGITVQSMHATVRALEERGAVRATLPGHGRAALLEITEEGRRLLGAVRDAAARLDAELLAELGDDERRALLATLQRVADPRRRPGPPVPGAAPPRTGPATRGC